MIKLYMCVNLEDQCSRGCLPTGPNVRDVMPLKQTSSLTIQWRISQKLDRQFPSIFFMGTSWVALSIKNIKTRTRREMTSRIIFFYLSGVNVAKHWYVAGRGICHL